jgi:predicted ATPase/transcriptional regulator with XRE-family HTH domain
MSMLEYTDSFGYWLRRYRKAHDFTQLQLADLAGCSRAMLRKIELDERRPSLILAERLANVLGLAEDERKQFLAVVRRDQAVDRLPLPLAPLGNRITYTAAIQSQQNLPVLLTELIGREQELADICMLVQTARCITLVGPGGIGKTSLAIAAAHALHNEFADGCWLVPLATISEPAQFLAAITQVLGLRGETAPEVQLRHRLRNRRMLLVLDNLEHLLLAAEQLAQLLRYCPDLHVVVTSRAPIRILAENIFEVPPLQREAATSLFVQRYLASRPGFIVSPIDQAAINEIVQRLDGLPLAIELAAARGHLLTPQSLQARLHDLPARQRTLREIVGWSYNLVSAAAQQTFAVLAVFVGDFDVEAVEAVDTNAGVLDRLALLLEHNLIQRTHVQSGRFILLETIAEYANEIIAESGTKELMRARHAHWYVTLAAKAEIGMCGAERLEWIDRLAHDLHNIRAALRWAISERCNPEIGLLLASRMRQYWHVRGHHPEARSWIQQGMALVSPSSNTFAQALFADGYLAWFQRDFITARQQLLQAVTLLETLNDQTNRVEAISMLAISVQRAQHDQPQAMHLAAQASTLALQAGTAWEIGTAYFWQGVIAADAYDLPVATQLAINSLAAFAEAGDIWNSGPHSTLGDLAIVAGDDLQAQQHYEAALHGFRAIGDIWGCAFSIRTLAEIALRMHSYDRAETLARASLEYWRVLDDRLAQQRVLRLIATIETAR